MVCTRLLACHPTSDGDFDELWPLQDAIFCYFAQYTSSHSIRIHLNTCSTRSRFSALKRFDSFCQTSDVCPFFHFIPSLLHFVFPSFSVLHPNIYRRNSKRTDMLFQHIRPFLIFSSRRMQPSPHRRFPHRSDQLPLYSAHRARSSSAEQHSVRTGSAS